jgi:cytochrome c553
MKYLNLKIVSLTLIVAALPLTAAAKGDPVAGKAKSVTCQACHGVDGKSIAPEYPNLAGQYASYMEKALRDYRDGRRTNVIMAPMAAGLSDQDIADLAAWYSKQDGLEDLSIK